MVKIYAELCFLIINHPLIQTLTFTKDDEAVIGTKPHYGPLTDEKFPLTFKLVVVLYCQFLIEQYTKLKSAHLLDKFNNNGQESHPEPTPTTTTSSPSSPTTPALGQRITLTNPMEGRVFCQFLGELYKFAILPSKGCVSAMDCLFSTGDEEDVLAMVDFATSVVPQHLATHVAKVKYNVSPKVAFPLENYLQRFNSIKETRNYTIALKPRDGEQPIQYNVSVSLRTKFLIMDFIDLYSKSKTGGAGGGKK